VFALVDTVGFDKTGSLYLYDLASGAAPRPLVTRDGADQPILRALPGLDAGKLELILATVPQGEQPVGAGLRYAPALKLMREWQDT
jgi:hypothetical protein